MRTLQIKVKPNSRIPGLEELSDGSWLARVKSPPVDGRANAELLVLVAEHFALRRAQVSLQRGASGRMKYVRLDD
jgi:uncharacterized protein (TIGR00251 family)